MSRTKLRQLEQVRGSQTYNDAYAGAHTAAIAENQSGLLTLEDDLNVLRTQIKQLKGDHLSDWYSAAAEGYTLSGLYDGYTQNSIDLEVLRGSFGTIIDSEGNFVPLLNTNYLEALTVSQYFQSLDTNLKRVDDGYAAEDSYLAAYVGKTGLGSEMPTYSSTYRVTQGTSLETAIGALDDGYHGLNEEVNNMTLQRVFNQGLAAEPDLAVPNNHKLDIHLGTDSWFEVTNSAGTNTFRVNDDGYVIIDGYLAVTGGTFQIDTVVTDADHLVLSPNIGSQAALKIQPSASAMDYTASLMELWTGSDGSKVVDVDADGLMTLETGLKLSYGNLVDGYYARSDASGNVSWSKIQDTEIASSFNNTNYLDAYTDVHSALAQLDSQISANSGTVGATAFNDGYGTTANGQLGGFVTYDVNVVANELYVDNTIPGSSVGIAATFSKTDFVSVTMESLGNIALATSTSSGSDITILADGYAALHALESVSILSSTDVEVGATNGNLFLSDSRSAPTNGNNLFRLSTSSTGGADFSSALRTAAGALGYLSSGSTGELGLIDAINTTFEAGGGGIVEKGVFVISSGDARLSNSNKTLALSAPERGSVDLTVGSEGYGLNFIPARDVEVWVNGMLLLPDTTQNSSPAAATDDYYLDTDFAHVVFSFPLVAGDVVVVKNTKAAPGETVSTGW